MQKLTHQLAGKLGETLALAKLLSLNLQAYSSPPGAPGHDIIVVMPDGPKSIEVKTRQYVDSASEISRWPVDMNTKADADYFLFVELNLRTLSPTFYLLNNAQAKTTHADYSGSGNCQPNKVRNTVDPNDFSSLTGEPPEPKLAQSKPGTLSPPSSSDETSRLRTAIAQEAEFENIRIVQYESQSVDVFVDDTLQPNSIKVLRRIVVELGVSEFNNSGGVRNTRQLGQAVIQAINERN